MHREVPVRLGKERWETHTATVVQGTHRLLHLPCGFDYQLLSAVNQSLILLRPVLRFFSLKSAFYSFPACGQLHRGQSAQAQQHKAQPEPGIADVTDFQNRLRLRRVGLFHRLVDLFPRRSYWKKTSQRHGKPSCREVLLRRLDPRSSTILSDHQLHVDDLSLVRLNRPPVDRHLLHHRLPNFGYAACIPAISRGRLVRLPPSVLPIVSGFFSAVYVTVSFTSRAPITPRTEERSGFILPPLGKPPRISRAPSWGS